MNQDKLEAALREGAQAEALLKSELLNLTFDYLEKEYIDAWRTWPAKDTDGREKLWLAVNILGKVRGHLSTVWNNGKMAKQDIERLTAKQG